MKVNDNVPKNDHSEILIYYQSLIEYSQFWSSRQNYYFFVQKFLNNEINGFEFWDAFLDLWFSDIWKLQDIIDIIEDKDKHNQIPDFCYTSKSIIFYDVINTLFFALEGDECEANESILRSFLEEYYFLTLTKRYDDS